MFDVYDTLSGIIQVATGVMSTLQVKQFTGHEPHQRFIDI